MSRRRILILFLTFLVLLTGTGYVVLHQTGAARSLVRSILGDRIREDLFELDDAAIDLTAGTVTVKKFTLENPELAGRSLLSVEEIQVEVETNPLGEVGAVRHVDLNGLAVHLSLAEGEMPQIDQILKVAGVDSGGAAPELPSIRVRNSSIHVRVAPNRPVVVFRDLELTLSPLESDPDVLALQGTARSPLGHVIRIQGSGNAAKRAMRTVLTMHDLPIKAEQAAAFQPEAAEFLAAARVSGTIKSATLWMDLHESKTTGPGVTRPDGTSSGGTSSGGTSPGGTSPGGTSPERTGRPILQAGLNAEFVDLTAAPAQFPYPVRGASGRLHASLAEQGTLKFRVDQSTATDDVAIHGTVTRCLTDDPRVDVHVELDHLAVDAKLRRALAQSTLPLARRLERAFAPSSGHLDVDVRIRNLDGKLRVLGTIDLAEFAATFHGMTLRTGRRIGFPYPVHDVSGRITLRRDGLAFENITGLDRDDAKVRVHGRLDILDRVVRPNFDVTGTGIKFSPLLRKCVGASVPNGAAIYGEYAPQGKADVTLQLRDAGAGLGFTVLIVPAGASAAYADFPYRVHNLQGRVRIHNRGVRIDLRGKNGKTPLTIDGKFLWVDDKNSDAVHSELFVKATELSIDDELRDALLEFAPELRDSYTRANPEGTIGCELAMWKEARADEFSYDVNVDVVAARARPTDLSTPIEKIRGTVYLHGTGANFRCDLSPLRGELPNGAGATPALLFTQGSLHRDAKGLRPDLVTIIRGLRLNQAVGAALCKNGVLSPENWQAMRLDGQVDVIAHHHGASMLAAHARPDLTVKLRDVRSAATSIPGLAKDLHGEITVKGGVGRFKRLEGLIDETAVTIRDGVLDFRGDAPRIRFLMDCESVPVDKRLACFMSQRVLAAFLDAKIKGRVGLTGFAVQMQLGDHPTTAIDGEVTAYDLFLDVGLQGGHTVQHLTGSAKILGRVDADGCSLSGLVRNVGFELSNQRCSAVSTRFALDSEKLELHDLRLNLAGGLVEGRGKEGLALRYRFRDTGLLSAFLDFRQVSLNKLLRGRGLGHSKLRGALSGHIDIAELRGANLLDMQASGEVAVENGRLGRVPIFSALYSHIAEEKRPQFTQARTKFRIEDQSIKLWEINARSNEFKIKGDGRIGMDGYMDVRIRLPGVFGRAADILILPPLIDWTVSKMVRFQLYGYIREPKLSWTFQELKERAALSPIGPFRRGPARGGPPRGPTR